MSEFATLVRDQLKTTRASQPKIASINEGTAIVWDKFLRMRVEAFNRNQSPSNLLSYLVQLAAESQRFAEDAVGTGFAISHLPEAGEGKGA